MTLKHINLLTSLATWDVTIRHDQGPRILSSTTRPRPSSG